MSAQISVCMTILVKDIINVLRGSCQRSIKNKNSIEGTDNYNGIFFYYPYVMKADTDYKVRVWMFFDECGPEDSETTSTGVDRTKAEIKFYLDKIINPQKMQQTIYN